MPRRISTIAVVVLLSACSSRSPHPVADAIPDVSASQQRTVSRSEFSWHWPLSVGIGTLGCDRGAVIFRSSGRSYALNEAASERGFAKIDPLWQPRPSGPPRNPLRRLKQHDRMQIFAQWMTCDGGSSGTSMTDPAACKKAIRDARGLSEADLTQIEAEGHERSWPPLERTERASLDPLIAAGLKLCAASTSG